MPCVLRNAHAGIDFFYNQTPRKGVHLMVIRTVGTFGWQTMQKSYLHIPLRMVHARGQAELPGFYPCASSSFLNFNS